MENIICISTGMETHKFQEISSRVECLKQVLLGIITVNANKVRSLLLAPIREDHVISALTLEKVKEKVEEKGYKRFSLNFDGKSIEVFSVCIDFKLPYLQPKTVFIFDFPNDMDLESIFDSPLFKNLRMLKDGSCALVFDGEVTEINQLE